jgi:XTP/dITP diphosphohydrolase
MPPLLIATRNAHKVAEVRQILGEGFGLLTLNDFPDAPAVIEDADTFAGNATKKILSLAGWLSQNHAKASAAMPGQTRLHILADDSGLEVDALGGAPGVHSARFAANGSGGGNAPDAANNAKLLQLLETVPAERRTARFRCVLAMIPVNFPRTTAAAAPFAPDQVVIFDGACEGIISRTASGAGGFGYDPLFVPVGFIQSFAALGGATKNSLSHRARALAKLRQYFSTRA